MDSNQETVKLLVDTLSRTLSNLSDKINGYSPLITQLTKNDDAFFQDLKKILFDSEKICENIAALMPEFYSRTDEFKQDIANVMTKLKELEGKLDVITKKTQDLDALGKVATFVSKPVGFLVFLIGMILASSTIQSIAKMIIDKFNISF